MSFRDDARRLADMLQAIENIERYAVRGRSVFDEDELIQSWIVRHIQIMREASGKLTRELCAQHPEIPWRQISGMRNILVHDYFNINLGRVWAVVENDLPVLKIKIHLILNSFSGSS